MLDRVGSVVAVVNDSGSTVSNRYAYDEYGRSTYTCTTLCTSHWLPSPVGSWRLPSWQ